MKQFEAMMDLQKLDDIDGIYYAGKTGPVSYDDEAHDALFGLEEKSYWFRHRNHIILAAIKASGYGDGIFVDVGGGNGNTTKMLQDNGYEAILFEPGLRGVKNAKKRGVNHIVCALFDRDIVRPDSVPAIGLFDVLEHIEQDEQFLGEIKALMKPGAFLFLTVPANRYLWSSEDQTAGHFRRYGMVALSELLSKVGFECVSNSHYFSLLPLPIWLFRTLPSKFRRKGPVVNQELKQREFILPAVAEKTLMYFLEREIVAVQRMKRLNVGASLIATVRKP